VGHYREDAYTTIRTLAVKAYINPANCVPYKLSNGFISANIVGLNLGVTTLIRVRVDTIYSRI
jgi:F0F1-type ATP synthase assembly protein I